MKASDVATLLRNLRVGSGKTIAEAAADANVGRWNLYRWENADGLQLVAEVLSVVESYGVTITVRHDRAVAKLQQRGLTDPPPGIHPPSDG